MAAAAVMGALLNVAEQRGHPISPGRAIQHNLHKPRSARPRGRLDLENLRKRGEGGGVNKPIKNEC